MTSCRSPPSCLVVGCQPLQKTQAILAAKQEMVVPVQETERHELQVHGLRPALTPKTSLRHDLRVQNSKKSLAQCCVGASPIKRKSKRWQSFALAGHSRHDLARHVQLQVGLRLALRGYRQHAEVVAGLQGVRPRGYEVDAHTCLLLLLDVSSPFQPGPVVLAVR